ncbi:TetR family transcriptional regulator [Mycolicibacterium sp. BiH015]|uniref:TetR/AcrR family transcriptional regulator n=1 Tax=Mycolicibacterium sp. BiH015 TaxID=3018808 RepID=UPI0022E49FC8|nr:TetR family transcriptional regulator [Mycolicibacterium sp. BiH015]MDA2894619.1 TetR family transcriptional regulator [Mycolicibacterium sp. BiH015]
MPPKSISSPRRYRSDLRRQQARATRQRIVDAAVELFAAEGYAGTTLAKIAAKAGVSAETVQGHGPKAALLIAAVETVAVGVSGEGNILNLDLGRDLVAAQSPDEAIDMLVATQSDVHLRSAKLAEALIGAANADPELDRYRRELVASVTLQWRRICTTYRERGWIRDDVPFDELVESSSALGGFEMYLRLTSQGWSIETYRRWARRMLAETVFTR